MYETDNYIPAKFVKIGSLNSGWGMNNCPCPERVNFIVHSNDNDGALP
jgi:hypothetical protein